MKRGQFGIRQVLALTGVAAVSALVIKLNLGAAFFLVPAWISFLIAVITRISGWKTRSTILLNAVAIDLVGASFLAYGAWVVSGDPQNYPIAILFGSPTESFLFGLVFFAPLAVAFAFAACYAFVLVD